MKPFTFTAVGLSDDELSQGALLKRGSSLYSRFDSENRARREKSNRERGLTTTGTQERHKLGNVGSRVLWWTGSEFTITHKGVWKRFPTLLAAIRFAETL